MCSRCHWAGMILVPRPGMPCERPGPAGSGGEPLPHTWRAELSRGALLPPTPGSVPGFMFPPSGVCAAALFPVAPPEPGAAGAPPLPRSDTRWRRPELQRPRRGPGSSLIPGLRLCPTASRALGSRAALPCRAAPSHSPAERPHWPSLPKCSSWWDTCFL